jgi:hypothetical protein
MGKTVAEPASGSQSRRDSVAKLVPGAARMPAIEALGDIFATLDDAEGTAASRRLRVDQGRSCKIDRARPNDYDRQLISEIRTSTDT